jgi:uncharacterized protein YkwD
MSKFKVVSAIRIVFFGLIFTMAPAVVFYGIDDAFGENYAQKWNDDSYARGQKTSRSSDSLNLKYCYDPRPTDSYYNFENLSFEDIANRYSLRVDEYEKATGCFQKVRDKLDAKKNNGTISFAESQFYGDHASYLFQEYHELIVMKKKIEVFWMVNHQRVQNGLNPLTYNGKLDKAAHLRAKELVVSYDHIRPDGRRCDTVLGDMGVNANFVGENADIGYHDAQKAMERWMESPGHRSNILNDGFNRIGIGIHNENGIWSWIQIFSD